MREEFAKSQPGVKSVQELMSYKDAAQKLNISEKTLQRYVVAKKIDCVRIGRLVRFTSENINEFIQECIYGA